MTPERAQWLNLAGVGSQEGDTIAESRGQKKCEKKWFGLAIECLCMPMCMYVYVCGVCVCVRGYVYV